jgi:hypothetical protein
LFGSSGAVINHPRPSVRIAAASSNPHRNGKPESRKSKKLKAVYEFTA